MARNTSKTRVKSRNEHKVVKKGRARAKSGIKSNLKSRVRAKADVKTPSKVKRQATARRWDAKTSDNGNGAAIPALGLESFKPGRGVQAGSKDTHKGSVRYGWLGSGQCGGRLVKTFYELGYGKVLAVNTTNHDLDLLGLPCEHKYLMDIGGRGAGKDMARGREAVKRYKQEILHHCERIFGDEVEHIMVCFGAGGGTGSGSAAELIELARDYARHTGLKNPQKCVGAMMTLPTIGEARSPRVSRNAYEVACELSEMAAEGRISPLVIMDNAKISTMYPGLTVRAFWPTINNTVGGLFDIFNRLSFLPSQYTSFDPVDYSSIMGAGGCAIMGLTQVSEFKDKFAISRAVKNNLAKTLLAGGFDLSTAEVAGCIVVGGKKLMGSVAGLQDNIDYAFDVLAEITGQATIHRGIYEDEKDSLRVYTIIGGLDAPADRLEELQI